MWAVDIRGIPDGLLTWNAVKRGIDLELLPIVNVPEPLRCGQSAAVLSWRWDLQTYEGRSRNVALALLHAKSAGLDLLFLDHISIDQNQSADALLKDVVAFGQFYRCLQVIAAYDEEEVTLKFASTLDRPWILHEIRTFGKNPASVTRVGFRVLTKSFENHIFDKLGRRYANVAVEVLMGRVSMAAPVDFAYILPSYSRILRAAHSALKLSDYLLFVFLLLIAEDRAMEQHVSRGDAEANYGFRFDVDLEEAPKFAQFSLSSADDVHVHDYEHAKQLSLDGVRVAVIRQKMTSSYDRIWISLVPQFVQMAFKKFGLNEGDYEDYVRTAEARRRELLVTKDGHHPIVGEAVADLDGGRWLEKIPAPSEMSLGFRPRAWESPA